VLFKDVDVSPIGKSSKDVLDRKQLQERTAGKESKKKQKRAPFFHSDMRISIAEGVFSSSFYI